MRPEDIEECSHDGGLPDAPRDRLAALRKPLPPGLGLLTLTQLSS
jgi:hypothetical protein